MNAQAAAQAFGTSLRLRLIRHYLDHPGPQLDAADALGVGRSVVSNNTRELVALGIVDAKDGVYRVNVARLRELKAALDDYLATSDD